MTEYRVVDGIASTPKGQQLYDQAIAQQNAYRLTNLGHRVQLSTSAKINIAGVSNRPKTAPRAYQWYAIKSDLVERGFPTVDDIPIPINAEQLGQSGFIDIWRLEMDGSTQTTDISNALFYVSSHNRSQVHPEGGIKKGDKYHMRDRTSGGSIRFFQNAIMSHSPIDFQAVGNRWGSLSGVRRSFGSNNTSQWVIDRQQIYSDVQDAITYKKVNGKIVEITILPWKKDWIKDAAGIPLHPKPQEVITIPPPEPEIIIEPKTISYSLPLIAGVVIVILLLLRRKNA